MADIRKRLPFCKSDLENCRCVFYVCYHTDGLILVI